MFVDVGKLIEIKLSDKNRIEKCWIVFEVVGRNCPKMPLIHLPLFYAKPKPLGTRLYLGALSYFVETDWPILLIALETSFSISSVTWV